MLIAQSPEDSAAYYRAPENISRRERTLLLLAGVFVALNRISLTLADQESWVNMWPLAAWLVCSLAMHIALNQLLPKRDPFIMPIVMMLAGWGLTLIARLAPPTFATRQTLWLTMATLATLLVVTLPPTLRVLQRYRYTLLIIGLVLLAATLIFGVNPSGDEDAPRLWLGVGGIYFQPSELLKIMLIVFMASYLADKREMIMTTQVALGRWRIPHLTYIAPMLMMWGFCVILLVWQRDLGGASLFFLVFLALLYASTGEAIYPLAGIVLLIAAGVLGYILFEVVRLRVDTWWNPWPEADRRAYQIVQSLLAVASGGVLGQGVGQGAPTFIPVVHSDFVFAAIAEEWGMVGALGVLTGLAVLVLRALRIATLNVRRPFHSLLAAGIGIVIGIQSLLIMAGVLKLVPLTGITLPFVSYGGSSLLSSFIMIALLLRISDPDYYYGALFHRIPDSDFAP